MGWPGGHEHDPIYSLSIYTRAFRANFSLSFPRKKIVVGKRDRCGAFGCNNDCLFPEKYTVKFSFCLKSALNTERVPPGHPMILFKFNKFNMVAVSVKGLSFWMSSGPISLILTPTTPAVLLLPLAVHGWTGVLVKLTKIPMTAMSIICKKSRQDNI